MDFIADLWLPILLSAVGVFIASSLVHMVIQWHNSDCGLLPNEDAVLAGMRGAGVKPGMYMFPRAADMKECSSPEMVAKYNQGPVGFLTVMPNGPMQLGKALGGWFLYCLVAAVFIAYIADVALMPGSDFMSVFRFTATAAFMAHGLGVVNERIWKGASWSYVIKFTIDGLLYALVTGAVFGWMWPELSLGM